jgi:asparagine synthase (glutamine-hydrolysing)
MAFSLESRDPLLEHDLVEWAMKLPVSWKLRNGVNKYLLRKLAYRFVPKKILDRPKKGFAVPIDAWLRGPLKAWAEERLHDKILFQDIPLNQHSVLDLWNLHQSGKRNVHPLLWAILMLLDFRGGAWANSQA